MDNYKKNNEIVQVKGTTTNINTEADPESIFWRKEYLNNNAIILRLVDKIIIIFLIIN